MTDSESRKLILVPEFPPVPKDVRALLGPSWTVDGEKPRHYEDLINRIGAAVGAVDIIDWLMVSDLVNITWDIQRFRRVQASTIKLGRRQAMEQALLKCLPHERNRKTLKDDADVFAQNWFRDDEKTTPYVESVIANAGLSMEDITSIALTCQAEELDRIDEQIERCENRRDKILQRIERRHTGWGKRVQRAAEETVDAEFQEIAPVALNRPANDASERPS
ncbi:MAG: hypothetical protein HXX10_19640 [Rhodoplanes sp.]|uniref:hypothetical protein n=1 Tax=Rhodoplanes sp. TaxID=1968906 RepID=UPI0017A85FD5|nr:hypothetical protein [Rhodoplanes sp.]NVO16251.1 hypothetical protein [Rhodoplanes sp.]